MRFYDPELTDPPSLLYNWSLEDLMKDIPNVGRFFVLQDPQGAVISAIEYVDME